MKDNIYNVDKNSLAFLFQEDIYIISENEKDENLPVTKAVHTEVTPQAKKTEPEKKIPSIPKIPVSISTKEYAVIVSSPEELESSKDLLGKILGAIKLDLSKADMFTSESNAEAVLAQPEYKYIISFGLDADKFKQPLNKVAKKGKTSVLFSDSLGELEKDVEKKKALWAALKQLQ